MTDLVDTEVSYDLILAPDFLDVFSCDSSPLRYKTSFHADLVSAASYSSYSMYS